MLTYDELPVEERAAADRAERLQAWGADLRERDAVPVVMVGVVSHGPQAGRPVVVYEAADGGGGASAMADMLRRAADAIERSERSENPEAN